MTLYKYRAKKGPGDLVEDIIQAESEKDAIEKLSVMGYVPVSLEEKKPSREPEKRAEGPHRSTKHIGRIRSREITIFSRELATLIRSGVPILRALTIIQEQSENQSLGSILQDIHDSVKDGSTFSSTLEAYPKVFSSLYIAMVRTGENSGALAETLERIADYRSKQEEVISRFRMALAYPVLMGVVGLATIIFMFAFVIPRLMKIYTDLSQELPIPTQILIALSSGIQKWWFWIIVLLGVIILLIRRQSRTEMGKLALGALSLRIPLFGNFILKADLYKFSRTLGLLIKNGLPILNAIDISIPTLDNEVIKAKLRESHKELEAGGSLGKCLKESRFIPPFMSNLVSVGEESGRLDEALAEIADAYERETDEAMKVFASLLEPAMILMMGLIVGFIVIAMLLPIFDINVMVR